MVTFILWFNEFFQNTKSKKQEQVLLIIDNCGPHAAQLESSDPQVRVEFLPKYTTSVFQLMDAGFIAMVKKNYKYHLPKELVLLWGNQAELQRNSKGKPMVTLWLNDGYPKHIADAINILYDVWEETVTPDAIKNCW